MVDIKPADTVLEPSAGRGAILQYIVKQTNNYKAVEKDQENSKYLISKGYKVSNTSFEQFHSRVERTRQYDKIVMNPPFSNKRDIIHTLLAYNLLKPNGTLVGLLVENSLYYKRPITDMFNGFIHRINAEVIEIPHGTFK